MPPTSVDSLDRSIIAALMVDGRASWRAIAEVLGSSERTVTRRGASLLSSGAVSIHAMADPHRGGRGDPYLAFGTSRPTRSWNVGAALARRDEAVTTYALLGHTDYVCDIWCPERRRARLFQQELPDISGIESMTVVPILRYIRTLHDWDPGILDPDQISALRVAPTGDWPRFTEPAAMSRDEELIVRELVPNGRMTYEELGRLCGVSEQTVARKVHAMRASQLLTIRAVFDPRLLGLPTAAFLWLRVRPDRVESVAATLAELPYVRYAATTMGRYQIVADIRLGSKDELYDVLHRADWVQEVEAMDSSLILEVLKQSEVLSESLR